jgi:hypothetical protein
MRPIAVEWGYHSPTPPARDWDADAVISEPKER